ncbi:hypothetical protein BU15DRAFT_48194 [Melanogaster broomeanus]|nr:hypothetical protein BU15DRAFT_48194 [Melanogaster broomeanus]
MVLLHETDALRHPYWYARVIRTFHVNIRYYGDSSNAPSRDSESQRMNVLFVRWFGRDTVHSAGFSARRLYRVGFLTEDPELVIRGVHLIPAFSEGRTPDYLGPSFVRPEEDQDEDWRTLMSTCESSAMVIAYAYMFTRFVDRDMFMRFRGGGVGHTVSRQWNTFLQADCQELRENDETFEIETRGDNAKRVRRGTLQAMQELRMTFE